MYLMLIIKKSMGVILSRIQFGLQKCTLFIIIIFITSLLIKRSAPIMLIQLAAYSSKIGAAGLHDHPFSQKPPDFLSPTSIRIIRHTSTMQQEKRVLLPGGDAQKVDSRGDESTDEAMKKVRTLRKRIGSRPPMCQDKCESCFPCEAVKMVPTPTISSSAMQNIAHLDYSNYDPEGWKCKCGTRIFNP
eukprot:c18838_g1_i1 orf=331-894(-)